MENPINVKVSFLFRKANEIESWKYSGIAQTKGEHSKQEKIWLGGLKFGMESSFVCLPRKANPFLDEPES
jgi:hypothetical protein